MLPEYLAGAGDERENSAVVGVGGAAGEFIDPPLGNRSSAVKRAGGGADNGGHSVVVLCVVDGSHDRLLKAVSVAHQYI